MTVTPGAAGGSAIHRGTTHHFCCLHCRIAFEADPEAFTGRARAPVAARAPTVSRPAVRPGGGPVEYTCPMHPEVLRAGPGTCPLCGMDLEPRRPTAEGGPGPEGRRWRR